MKPVTFSNADWEKIKESLADVGLDADTVSVLDPQFVPAERYPAATMQPLRDVLQQIANFYSLDKPPTPKQQAEDLKEAQAALNQILATLRRLSAGARKYPDYPEIHTYRAKDDELHALMAWKIAALQKCIDRLKALGSSSKHSRRRVLREYFRALTERWQAITIFQNEKRPLPKARLGR